MAAVKSGTSEDDEGYPPSSAADLDPGPDTSESLEEADRESRAEQRVSPEGRGPDASSEDEDASSEDR